MREIHLVVFGYEYEGESPIVAFEDPEAAEDFRKEYDKIYGVKGAGYTDVSSVKFYRDDVEQAIADLEEG